MYLGATLSNARNKFHVDNRIKACREAFSALQSSGVCKGGLKPDTISYIWKCAIQPVLTYAIHCFNLKKREIKALDVCQARLLKSALGLSQSCFKL